MTAKRSEDKSFDVIIVGGGPIGLACGIACHKANLKYVILEKGMLVHSIYHFPHDMTFFSTSKLLELDRIPFVSHTEKPTRKEALEYYRRVAYHYDLHIRYYECVEDIQCTPNKKYTVSSNKGQYHAQNVVLATGFYDHPRLLGIPGEDKPHVSHYYTDVHPFVGHNVVVIGGANSACDVALELYHKGCQVTMVIRNHELYPKVKYWIKPNIENRIKNDEIRALFYSEVVEIMDKTILVNTPSGQIRVPADFVLAMTGYQPDMAFLDKIGVHRNVDDPLVPSFDQDTMMTNRQGIYIAGVLAAGLHTSKLFIENTRHHAHLIVQDILSRDAVSK